MLFPSIPVINLEDNAENVSAGGSKHQKDLVQTMRSACQDTGFFYVQIPSELWRSLEEAALQSRELFALPLVEKLALVDNEMARGYSPAGEETNDPDGQSAGDTKEGFFIAMSDVQGGDPRHNPAKLVGPNQWPDKERCPSMRDPIAFRTAMVNYMDSLAAVARILIRLIAESLDLHANYFDEFFVEPMALLGLLRYEPRVSELDKGIIACGSHTDYGMMTLLWTEPNDNALEIEYEGTWIPVPSRPKCLIVNLGDMLERWSNGRYKSTKHRVVNRHGKERYSMPFFFEPAFDTRVECLVGAADGAAETPKYPPITSGEHLLSKYRATHADFTPTTAS